MIDRAGIRSCFVIYFCIAPPATINSNFIFRPLAFTAERSARPFFILLFTFAMRSGLTNLECKREPRGRKRNEGKINAAGETKCARKYSRGIRPLNREFPHHGDFAARWMMACVTRPVISIAMGGCTRNFRNGISKVSLFIPHTIVDVVFSIRHFATARTLSRASRRSWIIKMQEEKPHANVNSMHYVRNHESIVSTSSIAFHFRDFCNRHARGRDVEWRRIMMD